MMGEKNERSDLLVRSRMTKVMLLMTLTNLVTLTTLKTLLAVISLATFVTLVTLMSKVAGEWQCVDCGMKAALNTLYAHVESSHVNVSFECIICLKECKTRNSLSLHRSRYHKGF